MEELYTNRPLVCLTEDWERFIKERYPDAAVYRRHLMKPAKTFIFPEHPPLPEGYRIAALDEEAFRLHPFSHGTNYDSYDAFRAEGSGTAASCGNRIVACASSFLSLDGEVELDVFTAEEHRGKGLAAACVAGMLRDCMERGTPFTGTRRTKPPCTWRKSLVLSRKRSTMCTGFRNRRRKYEKRTDHR